MNSCGANEKRSCTQARDSETGSAVVSSVHVGSEWNARLFDYDEVGDFYDYMLVRKSAEQRGVESLAKFPYERIYSNPPWELYRHLPDEGVE